MHETLALQLHTTQGVSAVFDTVDDHGTLLNRLETRYAISGTPHAWFESYLKGWASQVSISGSLSDSITLIIWYPTRVRSRTSTIYNVFKPYWEHYPILPLEIPHTLMTAKYMLPSILVFLMPWKIPSPKYIIALQRSGDGCQSIILK